MTTHYSYKEMQNYPMVLNFPTHQVEASITWCPGFFRTEDIGKYFEYRGQIFIYEGFNKAKFQSFDQLVTTCFPPGGTLSDNKMYTPPAL